MDSTDNILNTDVLVIGAGPGGYVAAIRAGQLGLDATLVDANAVGGTCLNAGCIPSKALITATDVAHHAETAEEMGVYANPTVDFGEMVAWKDSVVNQLTSGVEKLCRANRVEVRTGRAQCTGPHTAEIVDEESSTTVEFEHAIVATGSKPIQVPGFEFDAPEVMSSRDALSLDDAPERLLVVGAGYIGMELSTMFRKQGSDVTIVEMLDDVLPTYEDDISRLVRKRAEDLGITFNFGERAADWSEDPDGDGIVVTTEDEDGNTSEYAADRVLVAVGRLPVTDTLALENVGLEPNDRGFLETDAETRTDVDHVFAVGDVAGEPMLAHKASEEGVVAAEVIAGGPATADLDTVPAAVFTDPEIGTVGLTEAEATDEGYDTLVGEFPFYASGRALTTGDSAGFVRVVADEESERVLGAQIVGPEASELIAELAVAVSNGLTLSDIAETTHTHPTLAEATMEAAENALGKAIHTLNR
ncbi:MAG: dihydrolipoyl dehydrogenase [Halobacteriota archaeon]